MKYQLLTLLLLACLVPTLVAAEWGGLSGRFLYDGKPPERKTIVTPAVEIPEADKPLDEWLIVEPKTGGIANVVVYLRDKKGVAIHPDYEPPAKTKVVTVEHYRFKPHILAIRVGQTLRFENKDKASHNVNFQPIGDIGISPLLPAEGPLEYEFERAQNIPQPNGCNIHPWMRGYILPRHDPYVAISANDGTFEIKNLPTGEREFQLWHEAAGYLAARPDWEKGRVKVTIEAGKITDLGTLKLKPELFKSNP